MNISTHECFLNEKPLSLTPTEFSILRVLCENKGNVVSSERLFHEIWGDEYFSKSNNTITVHIRHLREKMSDTVDHPKYIKTVWVVAIKLKLRSKTTPGMRNLKENLSQSAVLMGLSHFDTSGLTDLVCAGRGDWLVLFFQSFLHKRYDQALRLYRCSFRLIREFIFIARGRHFIIRLALFLRRYHAYFD